jgi:two-component system, cell cycle sensor histidine kinase and response regulator CckA
LAGLARSFPVSLCQPRLRIDLGMAGIGAVPGSPTLVPIHASGGPAPARAGRAVAGERRLYRIVRPNGSERWIRSRLFPIQGENKQPYRVAGLAEDITRHKQLESQFLQAQKMESIGRLAGGVAHDFRNLLTAIGSFAELAYDNVPDGSPEQGYLEQIRKATERAVTVTSQLLAFARKQHTCLEEVRLPELLANLEQMLQRMVREDVQLVLESRGEPLRVRIDPGQFEQVIVNLVVNAVDAMPEGGRIALVTEPVEVLAAHGRLDLPPGSYVLVSVSDTGIGLSQEVQDHLFEPFFTTKQVGKGTGLGLATSYGIIKQSGGHIEAESRPGQGTTFRIYLPGVRSDPLQETHPVPADSAAKSGGHETILIVEDQPQVRKLACLILSSRGYHVLEAGDGEEALRISREQADRPIHLVIADMVLPKVSGRELVRQLQFQRPEIRFVFMSGYTEETFGAHGPLEAGTPFISKPFTPDLLAYKVREVLDR